MPIEIQGIESIQKKLKTLDDALNASKMRGTLLTVGNMVKNSITESFENEMSPFGQKWSPLKIATIKAKARRGESSKILRATGILADTWMVEADGEGVTVSGNAKSPKGYEYGSVHQYGKKRRPFLPIDDAGNLEPRLLKTIDTYLENKISALWK